MSPRVGVVVNRHAGHGRARTTGARVLDGLRSTGADVVDLTASGYDESLRAAREARSDLDALVVVGGDGSVHLGVEAVGGTSTPLVVVPAGSGNDFAACAGAARHRFDAPALVAHLARATSLSASGETPGTVPGTGVRARRLDLLRATTDGTAHWVAGALSVGIDAAVNARANTYRWPRGRARYLRAIAAEVLRSRPYGYRVTIERPGPASRPGPESSPFRQDLVWEGPGTLAVVANIARIGGGIRVVPPASLDDGLLDLVLAERLSRARLALDVLPRLTRGRHLAHARVHHVQARGVVIEASPHGAPPPGVFGDGEPLGRLPLHARVVPGALHLLA